MKKRILSTFLALCLVLGMLPGTAWAGKSESVAFWGSHRTFSLGKQHIAAIDTNGSLWTWGKNYSGQLGTGQSGPYTEYDSLVPVHIMDDAVSVVCGGNVTAAIKRDSSLWMWGSNTYGELGNGTTNRSDIPIKVMDNVSSVCFGHNNGMNVAAIKTDGSLWMWGYNGYSDLGIGNDGNAEDEYGGVRIQTVPVKILDNVASVTMGSHQGAAIKTDGTLWVWGYNSQDILSNEAAKPFQTVPIKLLDDVVKVSIASGTAAVIKADGSLWMWGDNYHGQLGNGTTGADSGTPAKVMEDVIDVDVGGSWVAAIKADKSLWTWGDNQMGALGNGTTDDVYSPQKILDNVVSIDTNFGKVTAIKNDGSLWTWGIDPEGYSLGNGGITNSISKGGQPCQTLPVKILDNVTAMDICCYSQTITAALKSNGSIWLWGQAILGNNSQEGSKLPITVDLTVKQPEIVDPPVIDPSPDDPPSQTYPVSYNLNGGNGETPATENYAPGTQVTVTSVIPTYNNLVFDGWSYGDAVYRAGQTFTMPSQAVTLYARWTVAPPQNCTVSYDLNGGIGTTPFPQTYAAGLTVTVTSNIPTKGTAEFLGWSDGSNLYQAGDTFVTPGYDVVLTAQWNTHLNDNEVFLKQPWGSVTCTLVSATMMLRRCAILDGVNEWRTITADAVSPWAWAGGLKSFFEYRDVQRGIGMSVARTENIEGRAENKAYLIDMLNRHEEGIVIWDAEIPHAVLLTDYDAANDTFYCADPAKGVAAGRIRLIDSMLSGNSDEEIIQTIDRVWYISNHANNLKTLESRTFSLHCPVEMQITVNGSTLDSVSVDGTISNDYATMTATGAGQDRNVTVTVTGNYVFDDVSVNLFGTDNGYMTFTVEYVYTDGTTETHTFRNVPVKQTTVGNVSAFYPQTTLLLSLRDASNPQKTEIWATNPDETATGPSTDFGEIDNQPEGPVNPPFDIGSVPAESMAYAVTLPAPTGGKVTASPSSATKGTVVTLTATPDEGYELASLTVTDSTGNELKVTDKGDGKYTFTMPDSKVTVDAVFQTVPVPEEPQVPWANPFTDVAEGTWYYDAVKYVSEKGLMNGTSSSLFSPDATTTRAMIWTILARLNGVDTSGGNPWYKKGQDWATANQISDGTAPDASITREQLITMLSRYKGNPNTKADLSQFADSGTVSDWAKDAIEWAVSTSLLQGSDGKLDPTGTATRAQVAAILQRYCETLA